MFSSVDRPRLASLLAALISAGCVHETAPPPPFELDEGDAHAVVFDGDAEDVYDPATGEAPPHDTGAAFLRLGVRFTAADDGALELRTSADGAAWSPWRAPTIVFSEEGARAGHIDVAAGEAGDGAARFFQHRVPAGKLPPTFVALEPIAAVPPPLEAGDEPAIDAASSSTEAQGLSVDIQSRASWGGRAPNCRSTTGVSKATIHHTAGANDDSTPVPVQLRQIQAFHMFTRGWCDVGYNFLVSRDGRIWEGRGYRVLGAHAENANSNNMGISFLGNYTSVQPPAAQQAAAARVLRWLHDRDGIPLSRSGDDGVKGHRQRGTTVTTCPGDALYARLGAIVDMASRGDFGGGSDDGAEPLALENAEEAAIGLLTVARPRATTDVDGDGRQDICARNATTIRCRLAAADGAASWQTIVDGPDLSNEAGWSNAARYETLRMADIDGDGDADLCGRSKEGLRCWKSNGAQVAGQGGAVRFGAAITKDIMSTAQGWAEPWHYATIHMADVDGDGKADVCGRRDAGFRCWLSSGDGFPTEIEGPDYGDDNGWRRVEHFATIRMGDVNGDGRDDVCARNTAMMRCWLSNGAGFPTRVDGPAWSNASGWDQVERWSTILLSDVDGDGRADLCGRGRTGFRCHRSRGDSFGPAIDGPALSDDSGWSAPEHYATIRLADIDGDGDKDVCARGDVGVRCWKWGAATTSFAASAIDTGKLDDPSGWVRPERYRTLRFSDIDGDGKADLCGRGSLGVRCFTAASGFEEERRAPMYADENGWAAEAYYGTLRL